MKRIILIGILVSVFSFSGLAFAGNGPPMLLCDPIPDGCDGSVDSVPTVPEIRLLPNHWILCGSFGETSELSWFTSRRGKGDQGGFQPTVYDTFGCNCESIIEMMEAGPYVTGDLDGHRKFGCSKSLIEEFIAYYYDTVTCPCYDHDVLTAIMPDINAWLTDNPTADTCCVEGGDEIRVYKWMHSYLDGLCTGAGYRIGAEHLITSSQCQLWLPGAELRLHIEGLTPEEVDACHEILQSHEIWTLCLPDCEC